jgi:small-conductance mechanosensitive channel
MSSTARYSSYSCRSGLTSWRDSPSSRLRFSTSVLISYDSDLEKVIHAVNATGAGLAADDAWKSDIIKLIQFERVDEFAQSAVAIKVLGDTKPLRQWAVAGEFRKRIKIAFDKAGIEIPFPERVMHQAAPHRSKK